VGRPVTLRGEPVVAGFPTPTCAGRLIIDKENWRLTFTPLTVHLQGRMLTVPVSIPFGGACQFKMETNRQGKPQLYTWTLRHIDAPRPREKRRSKARPTESLRYGDKKPDHP
jgi:hypothetical protein